jgi:hypothetical protein
MTLKLFTIVKKELEILNEKSRFVEENIVKDQHRFFVDSSGLGPFLEALKNRDIEVYLFYYG